jgi:protein-S-isoprenylcysteine O-methyltransferase Ste14
MNASGIMHRWGVGPVCGLVTLIFMLAAIGLTARFPAVWVIDIVPYPCLAAAAFLLGVAGVVVYVWGLRHLNAALRAGALAVHGPYAVVRHPIYAAWILLLLPAVALALKSWPLLAAPAFAYTSFKIWISQEDKALAKAFRNTYKVYRAQVAELFPDLRPRHRNALGVLPTRFRKRLKEGP